MVKKGVPKMKGQLPEEMGWTLIFLLVFVFLIVTFIIFGLIVRAPFTGMQPLSYSIEFVNMANRPYILAEILSHYMFDDRQFLEHALESIIVNSKEKANSLGIENGLKQFLKSYELKFYSISVKNKDENELISASNKLKRCGENGVGVCTERYISVCKIKFITLPPPFGTIIRSTCEVQAKGCGNGRIKIDDPNKDCALAEICCMEHKDNEGHYLDENNNILPNCGPPGQKIGVCDDTKLRKEISINIVSKKYALDDCRDGRKRIEEEDDECKDPLICCTPLSDVSEVNLMTEANIPLLYKDQIFGYIEVVIGD